MAENNVANNPTDAHVPEIFLTNGLQTGALNYCSSKKTKNSVATVLVQ